MKESIFIYIYGYLPGTEYGGPVTSIYNFTEHFGDEYDIRIVCSNHDANSKTKYTTIHDGWNKVGKASVMYLNENEYKETVFTSLMKPHRVKMVYLTGVFSYFLNHAAIKAAKQCNIPVVIATRGEICKNILSMKQYKKKPYLFIMKLLGEFDNVFFQATSHEEIEQLRKYLDIEDSRIYLLPNIHGKIPNNIQVGKSVGHARMLYVSRIHPKKNYLDVLKAAHSVKGHLELDVYGPIEDQSYWKSCCSEIATLPDNVTVEYRGPLNTDEAKKIYCGYHAFTFPTLTENYGHVIVESMLAQCPIILSKGTTPWDDIHGHGGIVCELHDIRALSTALQNIIDTDQNEFNLIREQLRKYTEEKLKMQQIIENYSKMIDGIHR